MSELTPSQQARRNEAFAKRRAVTRPVPTAKKKFVVDRKYYESQLNEVMTSDEALISDYRSSKSQEFLNLWDKNVDPRWAGASLDLLQDTHIIEDRIKRMKSQEGLHKTSFLSIGIYGAGKTYSAYAYARELISQGVLTPKQICIHDEHFLAEIMSSGYKKGDLMAELLSDDHKLFIFDDVGQATYGNSTERRGLWHSVLDHIYSRRLAMVMTTNLSIKVAQGTVDIHNNPVTKNEINMWLGDAAFDRLSTLVGHDGIYVPGIKNKRAEVFKGWEDDYLKNS